MSAEQLDINDQSGTRSINNGISDSRNDEDNIDDDNEASESPSLSENDEDEELQDLADIDAAVIAETPADAMFAETKRQQEEILSIIEMAKTRASSSIDLSERNLQSFPDELLKMPNVEYMYLEGNNIAFLPDELFKCLPKLQWLDLRNNQLSRIPSVYLSSHTCLRNLLLEGNNIRNLPLELGLVKSLHGLNIANNPLEFPPQEIIEKGTRFILNFLVSMMDAKNTANMADLDLSLSQEVVDGYEHISASSDDWNTTASMMELARRRQTKKSSSAETALKHANEDENGSSLGARSAELHRPASYKENKVSHIERLKKAGALGVVERKKEKVSKMSWKVNPYPAPPSQDYILFKMNEEKQLARVKDLKEKTHAILQRRKDDAHLKNWREDAKVLQRKKYMQQMQPGEDYEEPGEQAPFAIEKEMMKVLTKEARQRADEQKEKEIRQQRAISPATKQRVEMEKQARIRELEKRIKDHTATMVERRKQPKGAPQHEMEIARRELEIAEQLHNELLARRKTIEYRFKAYSADLTTGMRRSKNKQST